MRERERERERERRKRELEDACHSVYPSAFSLYMLWNQMHCMIQTAPCD
jgi:hypothetical protein